MVNAQEYFDKNLTNKDIKKIDESFTGDKITGDLIIQDYPNLEQIILPSQEITSLTVINCPNLKEINIRNNQISKLEIAGQNITELIAGQNQLTSLNLTNCPEISCLIIPDNPFLSEIKGLNLAKVKEINVANTLIDLGKENEELKAENKRLYEALNETDEIRREGKLFVVEPIQTPKQSEEAILRHLKKVEQKYRSHFENKEINPLLEVHLKSPVKKREAQQTLIWIVETQTSKNYQELAVKWSRESNYQELVKKWKNKEDYGVKFDYDGSLNGLIELVENRNYVLENEAKVIKN